MMRQLGLVEKNKSGQDYVCSRRGGGGSTVLLRTGRVVREFVTMPLDSGYSVTAQVTGQDLVGGLRFRVTPVTPPWVHSA